MDWDKVIMKTIVDMVERGEISRESMLADGSTEEEVEAFFTKDLVRIKKKMAEGKE